jgi:glyoxylase I family protein
MGIMAIGVIPLFEVFDMACSVAFYREVIGFDVVRTWAPEGRLYWAMLKLGGATIMLNGRYEDDDRPGRQDALCVAAHADTELYFACDDVDRVYEHLRDNGCSVGKPAMTSYGMKQVWITDPDGFRLCFQQSMPESF